MRIDQSRQQHSIAKIMQVGPGKKIATGPDLRETPLFDHKRRSHQSLLRQYAG
jgi:hypothetical protein